jgi:hypothetical protein
MTSSGIKRSIEPKTMTCEITIWLFEFIKNHQFQVSQWFQIQRTTHSSFLEEKKSELKLYVSMLFLKP